MQFYLFKCLGAYKPSHRAAPGVTNIHSNQRRIIETPCRAQPASLSFVDAQSRVSGRFFGHVKPRLNPASSYNAGCSPASSLFPIFVPSSFDFQVVRKHTVTIHNAQRYPGPPISMAEVLGVVASGIAIAQIAGQAGGAVLKLKQLWDEVRDVPNTIAELMEQIDCLDPALWETENHFNDQEIPRFFFDHVAAHRSTEYCRKALEKLSNITNDLAALVRSRKSMRRNINCVRVVLRREEIKGLEQRLRNAIGVLQIAQQNYIMSAWNYPK